MTKRRTLRGRQPKGAEPPSPWTQVGHVLCGLPYSLIQSSAPPPQQHQSLFTRLKSFLCPDITSCLPADHVELVKRTMAAVALPSLGVPSWAREISDEQWKDMVQNTLQSRQSASALRLGRRSNVSGP